jgi:predicted nucleic acid-binding protein
MWAIPEEYSPRALQLADQWIRTETRLLAPCLLIAEATNALYKRVLRRELTLATARRALDVILAFAIDIREEPGLAGPAMEWASTLRQPTAYDGQYLALAERYDCELWTGDRRLVQVARPIASWGSLDRTRAELIGAEAPLYHRDGFRRTRDAEFNELIG